jgi:glycosyltransferase involved in cell wall biosynthesis
MKILHVTLGFYPAVGWGGPVKIVHENGCELVRRGHEVTVCCTNLLDKHRKIQPGTFQSEIDGLKVHYFDTINLRSWPGTLGPIWIPEWGQWLRREIHQFDVVHLNGYRNFMNLPVVRAALAARVPVVMQPHGGFPVIVNSFVLKRLYDRFFGRMELGHVAAVIAGQDSERQQALARGVPEERIQIIYNGLDARRDVSLPEPGTFRRRFGLRAEDPLILFLARINRKKGADMMVEAFVRLKTPKAQLAIAGPDDGQLQEVLRLITQYKLQDRVILPGLLSGSDVDTAFRDANLYVLPCRTDTFPQTIIESCYAGTPMVISDTCESAYLIENRIGDVVPFDADAFAAAIDRLFIDRERYARYQANCPGVMEDTFSIRTTVDKLEALYRQVIADSSEHE